MEVQSSLQSINRPKVAQSSLLLISMPAYAELHTNQLASIISSIATPKHPLNVTSIRTVCLRYS